MTRDLDRLTADPHPNDYDRHEVGAEEGDTCGRYEEPDEDMPRGYKPKPCKGMMMYENDGETVSCAICGETA